MWQSSPGTAIAVLTRIILSGNVASAGSAGTRILTETEIHLRQDAFAGEG
jgi:hypothetical protein